MIAYLRARLREWSTWIGLAALILLIVSVLRWRVELWTVVQPALVALASILTPGHFLAELPRLAKHAIDDAAARHLRAALIDPAKFTAPPTPSQEHPMGLASEIVGLVTGPLATKIEAAAEAAAVPALLEAVGDLAGSGAVSADVGTILQDVTTDLADAKAGKLSVTDIAKTVEDLAAVLIALEAKPPATPAALQVATGPAV